MVASSISLGGRKREAWKGNRLAKLVDGLLRGATMTYDVEGLDTPGYLSIFSNRIGFSTILSSASAAGQSRPPSSRFIAWLLGPFAIFAGVFVACLFDARSAVHRCVIYTTPIPKHAFNAETGHKIVAISTTKRAGFP